MREHDEVGILASTPQYRISVSGTSTPNVQYNDFGWDSSLACGERSGAKKLRENGTCGSLSAYQVSEKCARAPKSKVVAHKICGHHQSRFALKLRFACLC